MFISSYYLKGIFEFILRSILFRNPFWLFCGSKEEFIQIPLSLLLVPNLKGRYLHILFYGLLKKYVFILIFMFIVVGVFHFVSYS